MSGRNSEKAGKEGQTEVQGETPTNKMKKSFQHKLSSFEQIELKKLSTTSKD